MVEYPAGLLSTSPYFVHVFSLSFVPFPNTGIFLPLLLSRAGKSTLIKKYCHKSHAIYLSFSGCKFTPTSHPRYFPKAEFPRETFQLISIFCFLEVRTVFRRWKERTRKHSPDNQVFRLNKDRSNEEKLLLFLET